MPFRYVPLPANSAAQERELEETFAADLDTDDEDDNSSNAESKPLNPGRQPSPPPAHSRGTTEATYDFENLDYDYPPPGSPPGPTMAIPNNPIGNNNGRIPTSPPQIPRPRQPGLFQRAAQAVFSTFRQQSIAPSRAIGGGIENDGVFANINAKPGRGRVVTDGDNGVYVVPEEVQTEAPPSYATAQADAVPPYWETTIHAPSAFGGPGEIMVDGLPTGSVFSFLWNFLVSMSFQFVGFLLTFLLHSTHAAKLGSRAGLGVTLIHYGFYLRTKSDVFSSELFDDNRTEESWWRPTPTAAADDLVATAGDYVTNSTQPMVPSLGEAMSEGSSEWLSFLLMTVGWFILLTSVLSFWRVKRWERSIVASNPPEENQSESHSPFAGLGTAMSFPGAMWRRFYYRPPHDEEAALESNGENARMLSPEEQGNDPNAAMEARARAELQRLRQERLQQTFRDAGLIL